MSVVAGIVPLNGNDVIPQQQLTLMLKAMRPAIPSRVETLTIPNSPALLGGLSYGPDAAFSIAHGNGTASAHMLCTGELYNDELVPPQSPADFLLERYERLGPDRFAAGLNGSFSAVVFDPGARSVLLVTDHMASFPFFLATSNNRVYFASEVKALLAVPALDCSPNPSAVLAYASSGFFLHRHTLVTEIQRMDYASVTSIANGAVKSHPYWRYRIEPEHGRPQKKLMSELTGLMQQAVQRRVRSGRVSILLSGGVDSRGILACAAEPSQIPAVVYSGRTRETRDSIGDWAIAERIAQLLNLNLSVVRYEGGSFLKALENSVFASDCAAGFVFEDIWDSVREQTGTEYVLVGDECMGWATGRTSAARILPLLGIHSVIDLPNLRSCLHSDQRELFCELSQADVDAVLLGSSAKTTYDRVDELYFQQRLINMLLPRRRVLARHGLLVRSPWLDLDVLNFVRTLPARFRIRKKLYRDAMIRIHPMLFSIPRAQDSETIDYRGHLARAEQVSHTLSDLTQAEHSPVGAFFDRQALAKLIQAECESGSRGQPPNSPPPPPSGDFIADPGSPASRIARSVYHQSRVFPFAHRTTAENHRAECWVGEPSSGPHYPQGHRIQTTRTCLSRVDAWPNIGGVNDVLSGKNRPTTAIGVGRDRQALLRR